MEFLGRKGDRQYYFHSLLDQSTAFLADFCGKEFVALIHCNVFQKNCFEPLLRYFLESNVRYVVCAGKAAEQLNDELDKLISEGGWDEQRGEVILTTGHGGESLDEALFQFVHLSFPEKSNPQYALLLAEDKAIATALLTFLKQKF